LLQLTAMVQDVVKAGVTTDTSLINARLDELEDKVSKMEQWLINLQAITDILTADITVPTTDMEVIAEEKEETEAVTIAAVPEPAEIITTKDMIIPDRKREENAKKISEMAADKIRKTIPNDLAARVALMSNKLNDFI